MFYLERYQEKSEFITRMTKNLVAQSISWDITFNEAKSISSRGPFGQRYTGRLNLLNEIGQVIAYYLVESLSYKEVQELLNKVFVI